MKKIILLLIAITTISACKKEKTKTTPDKTISTLTKAYNFENYQNFKGSTSSLSDFKGKYIYIDFWATWCPPCKREIPYFKKLVEQYKGKNIEFVAISLDQNNEAWKSMIIKKEMIGVQLFYQINSIPRFILIDPQGNLINSNAPRPSEKELHSLLESLNL